MRGTETRPTVYRFGGFELQTAPGELRKHGVRIRLQGQPLQLLVLLLEHAGELVTREQIQNKLWEPGTYVDYDNAINSAMRKLREALSDDSGDPRFIETFARRGYRFIGDLDAPLRPAPAPRKSRKRLVAGLCGAILVVVVAAGGWWLLKQRLETKGVPRTPAPLYAASGWEDTPSLSPDGNQVAYRWRDGSDPAAHIYLKLIGEGKPVRLTSGAKSDEGPAWSPDGHTIAFLRDLDSDRGIYIIPALGGAERQIAEGRFFGRKMAWSPDGRFLAVSERQPAQTIEASLSLISVANGDRFVLTKPLNAKTADADPVFSPDGHRLLFTRYSGVMHADLYLLDLAVGYRTLGNPQLLRQESGAIDGATWTANGSEVIYALGEGATGKYRLMRIRAQAGSQPEWLTFTGEGNLWPAIAPHGNRLVYTVDLEDADIWQVQPGGPPRSFVSSTRTEYNPQYSPDGRRVAFSSDRSGLQQVWVCDAGGGDPVQLTRFEWGASGTPRWSPDGHWIAFDHQEMGAGWRIYVMASDGGLVRRLTQDEGDSVIPSWSTDGKWIYYSNNQTGRLEVWKRASQGGGQGVQVTHNGGWAAFESHDGQSLYYEKYLVPGLWVLRLGSEEERKVLESVAYRNFVVEDDGIYYMPNPTADGGTTVRFHSFATDQDKEIARVSDVYSGLAVSPNRKTILFSYLARVGSNVMVVDGFR
jgi:Tol biopolymer transport system component/DNA-binding winged helix-turn-helix (wHTH) protein